jgi:predicted RNA binding protein YcfA (HicA-like mRNA interferase family)
VDVPKAAQVLAALQRDGWVIVRQRGSHRRLRKGSTLRTWAFHDGVDLGNVQMTQIARLFGYTIDELRRL